MKSGLSWRQWTRRTAAAALAAGGLLSLLVWATESRVQSFRNLDPRIDQATFAQWVRDLRSCDRVLPVPRPNEAIHEALQRDNRSTIAVLLKPVVLAPVHLFTTVSLAIAWLHSASQGDAYQDFLFLSIAASVWTIVALCLLGGVTALACRVTKEDPSLTISALLPAALLSINLYSHDVFAVGCAQPRRTVLWSWRQPRPSDGTPSSEVVQPEKFARHVSVHCWPKGSRFTPIGPISYCCRPQPYWPWRFCGVLMRGRASQWSRATRPSYWLHCFLAHRLQCLHVSIRRPLCSIMREWGGQRQRATLCQLSVEQEWMRVAEMALSPWALVGGLVGLSVLWIRRGVAIPLGFGPRALDSLDCRPGFSWNGSDTGLRRSTDIIPFLLLGAAWLAVESSGSARSVTSTPSCCEDRDHPPRVHRHWRLRHSPMVSESISNKAQ